MVMYRARHWTRVNQRPGADAHGHSPFWYCLAGSGPARFVAG
jgi:hypothetical protein